MSYQPEAPILAQRAVKFHIITYLPYTSMLLKFFIFVSVDRFQKP